MNKNQKIIIHKVIDKAESYYTQKKQLFSLPFRLGVVGASHRSGKTNFAINALARKEMYANDFKAENIYIFSPSLSSSKWTRFIEAKQVPEENLFGELDEGVLQVLYEDIENEYHQAVEEKRKPPNKIIIFDDLGFGGSMRQGRYNMIDKLVMNGRHFNLSSMFLVQSYKQLSPDVRGNLSGLIVFNLSTRELESIVHEHNYLPKSKQFMKLFRKTIKDGGKHSFFVINYSNDPSELYMDKNFIPVRLEE